MNKIKRYFKNHPDAIIQDYNNQRHRMHIIQVSSVCSSKYIGSKSKKKLLALIPHTTSSFNKYFGKYTNRNEYIV